MGSDILGSFLEKRFKAQTGNESEASESDERQSGAKNDRDAESPPIGSID